jgi:RimJ/RimL family protein N-acetyltransferase
MIVLETARLLFRHHEEADLERKLGLSRIEAGANTLNLASNRVLQKLGFVWVRSGEGGGNSYHDYELRNPFVGL